MTDSTREIAVQALADIARLQAADALARRRDQEARERHPVHQAGRALHGIWRSIITGGWE